MTNEEAIKHLKWFSEYNEDEYCGGDRMQKDADWYYYINKEDFEAFDVAIKALEQELILDKIRAEIKKAQTYKMFEGEDTVYVERKDVLAIIDKCKAESEDKE